MGDADIPGGAGPCMCCTVWLLVRFDHCKPACSEVWSWLSKTSPLPLPGELLAGVSWLPLSAAPKRNCAGVTVCAVSLSVMVTVAVLGVPKLPLVGLRSWTG